MSKLFDHSNVTTTRAHIRQGNPWSIVATKGQLQIRNSRSYVKLELDEEVLLNIKCYFNSYDDLAGDLDIETVGSYLSKVYGTETKQDGTEIETVTTFKRKNVAISIVLRKIPHCGIGIMIIDTASYHGRTHFNQSCELNMSAFVDYNWIWENCPKLEATLTRDDLDKIQL